MPISISVEGADNLKMKERIREIIKKGTSYTTQELIRSLKSNSPVRTGYLKKWFPTKKSDLMYTVKSPAHYVGFVNDGTGIYGPRKTPIYSKKAGAPLVFQANGGIVAVKYIRGQKGQKFVERSIEETGPKVERLFIRAAAETDGVI